MAEIKWSRWARADRDEIFDYIETDSPQNAILVDQRIMDQIPKLGRFPNLGRPGRVDGTRELVIQRTPFIGDLYT